MGTTLFSFLTSFCHLSFERQFNLRVYIVIFKRHFTAVLRHGHPHNAFAQPVTSCPGRAAPSPFYMTPREVPQRPAGRRTASGTTFRTARSPEAPLPPLPSPGDTNTPSPKSPMSTRTLLCGALQSVVFIFRGQEFKATAPPCLVSVFVTFLLLLGPVGCCVLSPWMSQRFCCVFLFM